MKRFSLILLAAVPLVIGLLFSSTVYAQFNPLERACTQAEGNPVACDESETGQTIAGGQTDPVSGSDGIINQVVNLLSLITAVIAVIIIIIAGLRMVLSTGDANKIRSSRDAIIYAVVGLVIIALSRSIIIFVINRVTQNE